jgi:hypothetical protein
LLARLAQRYGTSTDYLLGLTDDPRPHDTELPLLGAEVLALMARMTPATAGRLLVIADALLGDQERTR